jgi:3-oxoacyl-[acyl-carrier-protein] synthase II
MTQAPRRVVITGIGALTPIGCGVQGLWSGLRRGKSAVRRISRFDASPFRSRLAAEIDDSDVDTVGRLGIRRARRLDRYSAFGVIASLQALEDAGLEPATPCIRTGGCYIGSALGGIAHAEDQHDAFLQRGLSAVEPGLAQAVFGGAGPSNVAIELGLQGPCMANSNSCASGAIAIGEAYRLVRDGVADVMLAGGVEAPLAPLTFGAFAVIKAMSSRSDDPTAASRPFDRNRDGFVMGEGAAMLVLESLDQAERRGAEVYAEIRGYAMTNDAHHMLAPRPDGAQAARAMCLAMRDADLTPDEIDYVNAHASATPLGDKAEAAAILDAMGAAATKVPVSGTKGLYGHPLGASGAIETAILALALTRSWLPGTTNLQAADDENPLHLIAPGGRDQRVETGINNAFGFGGINASLVLSSPHATNSRTRR